MLKMRLRVRPCSARCSPRFVGRVTCRVPLSCSTFMSREMRCSSWPFGPFTRTSSGSIVTSTPLGTGMGCFPIRLIAHSPDVCDHFAADACVTRLVTGHHAPGRGHDRGAHAAEDLRHLASRYVLAPAGTGHAL